MKRRTRLNKKDRVVFIGTDFCIIEKGTRGTLIDRRGDGRWVVRWDHVRDVAHKYLISTYGKIPRILIKRSMLDLTKRHGKTRV